MAFYIELLKLKWLGAPVPETFTGYNDGKGFTFPFWSSAAITEVKSMTSLSKFLRLMYPESWLHQMISIFKHQQNNCKASGFSALSSSFCSVVSLLNLRSRVFKLGSFWTSYLAPSIVSWFDIRYKWVSLVSSMMLGTDSSVRKLLVMSR